MFRLRLSSSDNFSVKYFLAPPNSAPACIAGLRVWVAPALSTRITVWASEINFGKKKVRKTGFFLLLSERSNELNKSRRNVPPSAYSKRLKERWISSLLPFSCQKKFLFGIYSVLRRMFHLIIPINEVEKEWEWKNRFGLANFWVLKEKSCDFS